MRRSAIAWLSFATLTGCVVAQSSALEAAAASYPVCAKPCLIKAIPSSGCLQGTQAEQLNCLCTNTALENAITTCVLSSCTTYQALLVKNATETMCGGEIRNESLTPLLVGVIGGTAAFVVFLARLLSATPIGGRTFGWDDWTIIAAVVLAAPPTAFAVVLSKNGLGKDIWTLPLKNIENVLFYYYVGEIFYFAALTFNKISLLLFMLRIFPEQTFRRRIHLVIGLCIVYGVTFVFSTTFQCIPVSYSWLQIDSMVKGRCNNINIQGWLSAIFNIIIDLIIIALPLKHLYHLHLPLRKKLMVMFMFSLGVFVTIVSAVRLYSLITFANTTNPTFDYTDAAWWSTIELHIGIICACLPSVRSLFVNLKPKVLGSGKGASDPSSNYIHNMDFKRSVGHVRMQSSDHDKGSNAPRHCDEGDLIPLVDTQAEQRRSIRGVAV